MDTPPNDIKLSIKQWAEDDRPREKMIAKGALALSDAELLAILIASGNSEESAVELSKRILLVCGNNLNELARLSINQLCRQFKGIGMAKAVTIAAALELGRRRNAHTDVERPKIGSSYDAYELFRPMLIDLPHEEFWVALLNRQNRVISIQKLAQGGLAGTWVDVRLVMKMAIEQNAISLIIAHNHPSGSCYPSDEDKSVTKQIQEAGKVLNIGLLDHIIVAGNQKVSFADEGWI